MAGLVVVANVMKIMGFVVVDCVVLMVVVNVLKMTGLACAVSGKNGWFGGCGGCDENDGFSGCD